MPIVKLIIYQSDHYFDFDCQGFSSLPVTREFLSVITAMDDYSLKCDLEFSKNVKFLTLDAIGKT